MSRLPSIGSLSLTPSLAPGDVARVARAAAERGTWSPCAQGCCLVCVRAAAGEQLRDDLRELMRSALTLGGVRRVHGSAGVVHEGRVVTLTVSHNRITHRAGSPGSGTAHRPAVAQGTAHTGSEGGGEVVSLVTWR